MYGFISGLTVLFNWSFVLPYVSIIHFDYIIFAVSFEITKSESSNFVHFQDCFGFWEPLAIPYKHENQILHSCKKGHWNFDRVCTDPIDHFG